MSVRHVKAIVFPGGSEAARVSMVRDDLGAYQRICGGDIEGAGVPIPGFEDSDPMLQVMINPEGKFLALEPNIEATKLLGSNMLAGDYIAGPMVVTGIGPDGEGADVPDELIEVVVG